MNCNFFTAAQSHAHPSPSGMRRIDIYHPESFSKRLLSFSRIKKFRHIFFSVLICIMLPVMSFSQLTGGVISSSACHTFNAAHVVSETTPISGENIGQPITYTWERSTDIGFGSITNVGSLTNLSDNYTLTGTTYYRRRVDNDGNTGYSNILTINPKPQVTGISPLTPDICFGRTSFPVTITALFNPDEYEILWTAGPVALTDVPFASNNFPLGGGITVQVVAGAPVGTYTGSLTLRVSATGCTFTGVPASAVIHALPTVNAITGNNDVCIGANITLANTTASGVWSSGTPANGTINGTGVLTGVSAGTTTVSYSVTDGFGCTGVATSVKTVNALPVINAITGNNAVCVGSTIGLANTTAGGVWSSGTPANGTVNGTGMLTGIANGTTIISYTVTDINSCVNNVTAVKTINPLPIVNAITGNSDVCIGSTIALANATAGGVWSSGTPANGTINGTGVLTGVANGTTIISYTVTDINSCVNNVTAVKTINPLPTVNAITGNSDVCIGSTIALANATAGGVWSSGTPANGTINGTGVLTGVANGTTIISYTVTDINSCVNNVTAVKTINPLPTVNAIAGNADVCIGSTIALSNATAGGVWSSGTPANGTINGTGVLTGVANGTTNISYTVTDINSCVNAVTAIKTINALPIVAAITGNNSVCIGSTIALSNATPGGIWSSGTLANGTINGTGVLTGVANGTTVISYTVTDINSCVNTVTAIKTINALPAVAAITGNNAVCIGSTITLGNTTTGGIWSSGTPGNGTVNSSGVLTGVANGTTTVSYTVTDINSCVNAATAIKTINSLPTVAAITGNINVCIGSAITLANATIGGVWSSSTPANGTINGTGVLTGVANGTTIISYTVTDVNSCITNVSAVKTINPLPSVNAIAGNSAVCIGSTIALTNATTGGVWSSSTPANGTINTSGVLTGVSNGITTVSYTVTDINSCVNTSTVIKTINSLPTVAAITGNSNVCVGSAITLANATPGGVWSSSTPANGTINNLGVLTGVSNGTAAITYTVTDINSCVNSATAIKTINPLPTVAAITGNSTVCIGSTIALANAITGGVWSSGTSANGTVNTSGVLTGISNGTTTISYTVTDVNNCVNVVTAIKTINPLPAVAAITGSNAVCVGSTITLENATTGGFWSSGTPANGAINNSGVLVGVSNGTTTISYTVTDINSCVNFTTAIKTINPLPIIATITGNNAVCVGSTITLTNTTPAGTWNSSAPGIATISASGGLTGVSAGTTNISYTVTDANNCTASVSSSKISNPVPVMAITNPASVCSPDVVDITQSLITTGSDPAADLSYWTNATATSFFITPNAVTSSGTYYIKGTFPATGCSSIRPVVATVNSLPSFSIANPAAVCEPAAIDITAATITNGTAAGLTLSYWRNKTAATALANPASITSSGTYYIKGINVTGCAVSLPVSVTVNPLPNGSLHMPSVNFICDGTPLTLTASNSFAYQWFNNQQPIGGATAATYNATIAGIYSVQFSSAAGCKKNSESTITLGVFVKPVIRFNTNGRCITSPVNFTNTSLFANAGNINWLWNFGDGSSSNNISVSHNYRQADSYNVSLTANNVSCPAFTDSIITVYNMEAPVAAVRYDTVFAVNGRSFILSARQIGSVYQWRPSTGLSSAVVRTPTATLTTDLSYTVSITSSAGCVTTDTVFVKMKNEGEVYVAQGFTPNGDGLNDRAYPILVGVKQLVYFKIFNRWGNLLFQTNDETPQNGWDGKYQGRMQQAGTYTWIAEVIDGNGKTSQKKGSLLLIN
jgi:gliding motility-associated-like protein